MTTMLHGIIEIATLFLFDLVNCGDYHSLKLGCPLQHSVLRNIHLNSDCITHSCTILRDSTLRLVLLSGTTKSRCIGQVSQKLMLSSGPYYVALLWIWPLYLPRSKLTTFCKTLSNLSRTYLYYCLELLKKTHFFHFKWTEMWSEIMNESCHGDI